MKAIKEFRGKYFFLSNFYNTKIEYFDMVFENNEAAFQSMKCPERMEEFTKLSAAEAKRLGRRVPLCDDWEESKETIMYEICLAKFTQHKDLGDQLLATGDAELIEGNTWYDTEWGVCNGIGKNKLGKILMRIREILKNRELHPDKYDIHFDV
ncbi:NADAR family protein [Candidatus Borkfalkia ceftriaxoniphila]|jgi:NH(3)-dependent NAD(+) synthetase|uniref:NADAR family protein n=1 Tax=Candidatus Borkfalkia ceftriaxoniphila TaxID=2508949 RepID=A0A4Q2KAI0_9FIRM|nr:NADAR family protein [Candidatus Borkfalkia ceftriaxoniphila]RXZ61565.1 NADAR family protein [Candidatus Borkfalkia ceftriaxoniphila]